MEIPKSDTDISEEIISTFKQKQYSNWTNIVGCGADPRPTGIFTKSCILEEGSTPPSEV